MEEITLEEIITALKEWFEYRKAACNTLKDGNYLTRLSNLANAEDKLVQIIKKLS